MNPSRAAKVLVWMANVLVPGAGLVLMGRVLVGAILAVVWGAAAAVWIQSRIYGGSPEQFTVFGVGALAALAVAQVLLAGRMRAAARRGEEERQRQFRAAVEAYLQDRLDDAETILARLLRGDPDDVEATLWLGSVARRRGDAVLARRYLVRARYLDDGGKWDFEIGRELAWIAEGRRTPAPPPDAAGPVEGAGPAPAPAAPKPKGRRGGRGKRGG
jgi:hypothetical protein